MFQEIPLIKSEIKMSEISIKTSSPAGDLISLMPSFRELYRKTGKRITIYQQLDVVGDGLPNQKQPFLNERGESIMMGRNTFDKLAPLLKSQEYIENVKVYQGQEVNYDMDEIRLKTFTNQPFGSIHRWAWYAFPDMACDLSEIWLNVDAVDESDKIIINFTSRYRNNWINYFFLNEYQDRLLFAGLPKERNEFCDKWLLNIPLLEFDDFYELACKIKSCRLFMSNQTSFFQIAEGTGTKRLLETCQTMPHVIPFTKGGYDAYHQQAMEFYFKKLIS